MERRFKTGSYHLSMRKQTEGGKRVAGYADELKVGSAGAREREKLAVSIEAAAIDTANCVPPLLCDGIPKRAGDRIRTGDNQLGKLALYQLSYARGEIPFSA
jgi:hypothetical protein